jgi:hypothetical protein
MNANDGIPFTKHSFGLNEYIESGLAIQKSFLCLKSRRNAEA